MGRSKRRQEAASQASAKAQARQHSGQPKVRAVWYAALLLVWIAVVYAPSIRNGFTYDDPSVIAESSELLSQPGLAGRLFSADYFRLSNESTYRPVVTLTYIVDWQISGGAPWMFHVQNVLWHLLAVGCLLILLRRLGASDFVRYASAALYGVHPALTEAVDAVAFREDVLVTAFGLIGLLLMTAEWPRRYALRLPLIVAAFAAALFSKESGVVFLLLVPLTHWTMARRANAIEGWRPWRHRFEYLAGALCTVGYLIVRFALLPSHESYAQRIGDSLGLSIATGVVAIGYYLRLLVFPYALCADYRGVVAVVTSAGDWRLWTSAIALVAISLTTWRWRKDHPLALWGWVWFLTALAPVSNLIPIPAFMAERFLYLPYIGLVAFATSGLEALTTPGERARRLLAGCAAVGVVLLSALTWQRHPAWSSDEVLWKTTLADHPTAHGALHGYGSALIGQQRYAEGMSYLQRLLGDSTVDKQRRAVVLLELGSAYDALGQIDAARQSFEQSLAAAPDPRAELGLALTYVKLGRPQDAQNVLVEVLRAQPDYAEAHTALGALLGRQGRQAEAIAEWREAVRLKPSIPSAHANLGMAYGAQGLLDAGIEELLRAIELQPSQPAWRYTAARLLAERGRKDLAIQQLEAAVRIDPGYEPAREALQELSRK